MGRLGSAARGVPGLRGVCCMRATSNMSGPSLRALLATSSVAALLIGGGAHPALACYTGPFTGGYTNTGATACIIVNNKSITGNLGNTGSISPGPTGIEVINHSTITGTISNAGAISVLGNGIIISTDSIIGGGIVNSGTLNAGNVGLQ